MPFSRGLYAVLRKREQEYIQGITNTVESNVQVVGASFGTWAKSTIAIFWLIRCNDILPPRSVFHSKVVIQNVSAKQSGGGFFVQGNVYISAGYSVHSLHTGELCTWMQNSFIHDA